MTRRKQTRSAKTTRLANRTKQIGAPVTNGTATAFRKPRPPLAEPFHVAVDRQLKSGHETYEAAEKVALKIKSRYPQLHVTVFDAKEGRHKLIEQPRTPSASHNKNRHGERNAVARPKTAVA